MLNIFRPLFLVMLAFVVSCGQKGPLYLPKDAPPKKEHTSFPAKKETADAPNLVAIQPLVIVGRLAQINATTPPVWNAILTDKASKSDLVRYIVFDDDVLSRKTPLKMLIGKVSKGQTGQPVVSRQLEGGNYLRFRSLETGFGHTATLIDRAVVYLNNHPGMRNNAGKDFLIDAQGNIDLYIAVKKASGNASTEKTAQ